MKIRIELERDEWYDIEWALRMAEMDEQNFAKKTEIYLETPQRERAEKVIEQHKKNAEKYRNLLNEIEMQREEALKNSSAD